MDDYDVIEIIAVFFLQTQCWNGFLILLLFLLSPLHLPVAAPRERFPGEGRSDVIDLSLDGRA